MNANTLTTVSLTFLPAFYAQSSRIYFSFMLYRWPSILHFVLLTSFKEMVNLIVTGKATSNTFDNIMEIDTGGAKKVTFVTSLIRFGYESCST